MVAAIRNFMPTELHDGGLRLVAAGQSLLRYAPTSAEINLMASLYPVLGMGDVTFTDMEVACYPSGDAWPVRSGVVHGADSSVLRLLKEWGFSAVAIANNHIGDYGPPGIFAALQLTETLGLLAAGAGADRVSAWSPSVWSEKGVALLAVAAGLGGVPGEALDASSHQAARAGVAALHVRRTLVADAETYRMLADFVSATGHGDRMRSEVTNGRKPLTSELDLYGVPVRQGDTCFEDDQPDSTEVELIVHQVEVAATTWPFVIVSLHNHAWAPDWSVVPTWLRRVAHLCVDAGAVAVLCHGVPVMAGIEIYRNRLCCYGLGNFIFHTGRTTGYPGDEVWRSAVISADFTETGAVRAVALRPVALGRVGTTPAGVPCGGFPKLAEADDAEVVLHDLDRLSRPFGIGVRQVRGELGMIMF